MRAPDAYSGYGSCLEPIMQTLVLPPPVTILPPIEFPPIHVDPCASKDTVYFIADSDLIKEYTVSDYTKCKRKCKKQKCFVWSYIESQCRLGSNPCKPGASFCVGNPLALIPGAYSGYGSCKEDTKCGKQSCRAGSEYCSKGRRRKCKPLKKNKKWCTRDKQCRSGKCSWFRCSA